MFDTDYLLEKFVIFWFWILFMIMVWLLVLLGLIVNDSITWKSCYARYQDAQYDFWGWCKIKYNWQYIPEDIYKKSFEKNINLNLK